MQSDDDSEDPLSVLQSLLGPTKSVRMIAADFDELTDDEMPVGVGGRVGRQRERERARGQIPRAAHAGGARAR